METAVWEGLKVLMKYGAIEIVLVDDTLSARNMEEADFTPAEIGVLDEHGWAAGRDDWSLEIRED